jgi:hypothetical protein
LKYISKKIGLVLALFLLHNLSITQECLTWVVLLWAYLSLFFG